jgi:sulfur carrier protein ThiS
METATIRYRKQELQVRAGMNIRAAIEKLQLDPLAVLAVKDKKLVNDQTILEPGDEIRLVDVISGG